jgi:predicted transposase/invertase (TIGR01784 family)
MAMRFLNPRTDFAFKKIFGSEESQDILLSFLNAILNLQSPYLIQEVQILDPYQAPKIHGMKDTYVDVKARDEQGREYIIEMQVLNVEGFEKRILYNACKSYSGQLDAADRYHLLTDVVAVTITNFVMFADRTEVVSNFKLRADDGRLYNEDLQLVFAELPKFTRDATDLPTVLDKWFYFLKHADDLSMAPIALQSLESDPAIRHALAIANRAGLTPEEIEMQERREMFIQDQRGVRSKALAEGLAEGLEKGLEQGIEKGKAEGEHAATLRIAQGLLSVMDDAQIAGVTGLPADTIKALRAT